MISRDNDLRALVTRALAGVEPGGLVEQWLRAQRLPAGDSPVHVIAVGKAAEAMVAGACRVMGSRLSHILLIAPAERGDAPEGPVTWIRGDHPMPSAASEHAGRAALAAAAAPGTAEALLVLLSGGASALMAAPAAGLTLADKQRTTARLLRSGVTIHELNTVRKHLSAVKGGRLAAASPVPVLTLAISDVVGDDPGVIGSGPTVADVSTFADALAIIERTSGDAGESPYPAPILEHLRRGAAGDPGTPESPKPGDPRLRLAAWHLVGGRGEAMRAAARLAAEQGYAVRMLDEAVVGEARQAAARWAAWVAETARRPERTCLISSGETTVRVTGNGRGGRNQEFALALVEPLAQLERPVTVASFGTDGVDGPTDAAGAIVRNDTLARASAAGMGTPAAFLAANDAWHYFEPLGDLLRPGPTGTNVGDVQIGLIG